MILIEEIGVRPTNRDDFFPGKARDVLAKGKKKIESINSWPFFSRLKDTIEKITVVAKTVGGRFFFKPQSSTKGCTKGQKDFGFFTAEVSREF